MSQRFAAREWAVDDRSAVPHISEFFAGLPLGASTFGWTCGVLAGLGPATIRLTRSQVAFRHRIGFGWLWRPGLWLAEPTADVVLSVALREHLASPRFTQVVQPYPGRWMHHLGVRGPGELDEEVAGWIVQAYEAAR